MLYPKITSTRTLLDLGGIWAFAREVNGADYQHGFVGEKWVPVPASINDLFTEEELRGIVSFLESPLGEHYLDGTWRMEAYTGTNMEETEELLVKEAVEIYQKR